MRIAKRCVVALWLFAGVSTTSLYAQTASLSGVVTDAQSGEPLTGANVILTRPGETGIVGGSAADVDGNYSISSVPAGSYTLTARYVGYNESQTSITLAAGESASMDIQLTQGGLDLNTIVISASRQAEKVLDAPASISVLDAREVEQEVVSSAISVLRNTTGVDVAQTGIDRNEVVLRGFNNAFSSSAYILTDYRQTAVPSLNVNIHSIMPTMPIDIERIEVVRGPGSALYGPGVDEGVIHFITKDPFSYPGTTVSVTGGERSLIGGQLRHAGVINGNLGYKVTGFYSQADDWQMDPNDPQDAAQLANDVRPRNTDFMKWNVNGTLQYRFADNVSITANGGLSQLDATVLTGIGTVQADGFGYRYGQLRLQANRFFAQAYFTKNDAGDSFVYGSGNTVVDKGLEYNAQAQYDFDLIDERIRVIAGADLQVTQPDTEGTILGRNENRDELQEFGGYVQATVQLTNQLDLTVAGRGDYSNIFDFRLSPRAALVFKANPQNTFRATYNQAFSAPGTNSLFLDIVGQVLLDENGQRLLIMGRGSGDGFTFETFRRNNQARMFLPVPGFFGLDFNLSSMPLIPIYAAAAGGGLVDYLQSPLPIPGVSLTDQQRDLLAQLLGYTALNGSLGLGAATDATVLGIPDASQQGFRQVAGPVDIEPLKQTTTRTIEVGYKGLINNSVLLAVDAYWSNKKNFTGPLLVETPLTYLSPNGLTTDMQASLGSLFGSTTDQTILGLLGALDQTYPDLTFEETVQMVAGILGNLTGNAFVDPVTGEFTPIAVVQSDQPVLQEGTQNTVGGFAAYRNFGNIDYWGVDASLQILASDELSLFGNVSIVSDDFFNNRELDEENVDLELALNAPRFKAKLGGSYRLAGGFSVNASGRYTKGFPVRSGGFYIGDIDSYFLIDLGAGYDFADSVPGLRADFTIQNLLDERHREFVGAPMLGRLGLARLTYSF